MHKNKTSMKNVCFDKKPFFQEFQLLFWNIIDVSEVSSENNFRPMIKRSTKNRCITSLKNFKRNQLRCKMLTFFLIQSIAREILIYVDYRIFLF